MDKTSTRKIILKVSLSGIELEVSGYGYNEVTKIFIKVFIFMSIVIGLLLLINYIK